MKGENMMKYVIVSFLLMGLLLSGACGAPEPALAPERTSTPFPEWLNEANRAWVVAHPHNWDADAEDDGLRVWVEVQDADENAIRYREIDVPVEIKIYSTESKTYPWTPARTIYSGSGSLTNWNHDAFVSGANGIKDIPWEGIAATLPSENAEWGILYISLTLPNGKGYSAQHYPVQIKVR